MMEVTKITFEKAQLGFTGEGGINYRMTLVKDNLPVWSSYSVPLPNYPGIVSAQPGAFAQISVDLMPEEEKTLLLYEPNVDAGFAIIETAGVNLRGHKFFFNGVRYKIPSELDNPAYAWPATVTEEISLVKFPWLIVGGLGALAAVVLTKMKKR